MAPNYDNVFYSPTPLLLIAHPIYLGIFVVD
jgi:hypothetical protein